MEGVRHEGVRARSLAHDELDQEEAEGEEQHEAQAVRLGGGAPRSPLLDILVV